jgi:hypothetical protein
MNWGGYKHSIYYINKTQNYIFIDMEAFYITKVAVNVGKEGLFNSGS